jgi:hydrogenase 3 maturation protease
MKTLPKSWKDLLHQYLSKDSRLGLPRTCLIGIGSDFRGDDSAGLLAVRELLQHIQSDNLFLIDGGPAPENFTSKIRNFHPTLVIFIDAAHMDEPPGTVQLIPLESIDGMSASTHSLPLSMLANFLKAELNCTIAILGIQPAQNDFDSSLSPAVQCAVQEIRTEVERIFSST